MSFACNVTTLLRSPQHTCEFARTVGTRLKSGDVILLSGEIGAGKSHFARCLIQSRLTVPEDVPSPTFTLVQSYQTPDYDIWHADLYRLTSVDEVEELGLFEAFESEVCLVEWPDRLAEFAPQSALSLTFEAGEDEDARTLKLGWDDPKWRWLQELAP